jgi:hypothetical protein
MITFGKSHNSNTKSINNINEDQYVNATNSFLPKTRGLPLLTNTLSEMLANHM